MDQAAPSPGEQDIRTATVEQRVELAPLAPVADATLTLVTPFASAGNTPTLGVSSASVANLQRSLIRFDQAAIATAIGSQTLYSARIDLPVSAITVGWLGGRIEALRMTRSWPEGNGLSGHGPTWVCADDTNTTLFGNATNDCTPANAWGMLPTDGRPLPYAVPATSRASIFTGGLGTISLDVTADVYRFLTGTPNYGWLIAGVAGTTSGELATFNSREASTKPALVLNVGPDLCPTDPLKGTPGQCGCGVPDLDTNLDGVPDCVTAAVTATADTTLRLAIPFGNDGTGALLGVTSASVAGLERTLVRVDQAAIDQARAGRRIKKAVLELTIAGVSLGWGSGQVEAHAMTRGWPEGNGLLGHGPSWFCADDQNTTLPGNSTNDCLPADAWNMVVGLPGLPFVAAATDSETIPWPGTGSVRFDVTADVKRFVSGAPNYGWLVKAREDLLSGQFVNFGSRESGAPPVLRLDLESVEDKDCDGMPDDLEVAAGLNPADPSDARSDSDGDGVRNYEELAVGGNPFSPDTDGDGTNDFIDLQAGRDFDGDGRATEVDNCPSDVNPSQLDTDGDGVGDACDSSPQGNSGDSVSFTVVDLARNPGTGAFAVVSADDVSLGRNTGDLRGFIPQGEPFNMLSDTLPGTKEVEEFVHPTTSAHAYALDAAERSTLVAGGFKSRGVLGSVSIAARPYATWLRVRRFTKGSGSSRNEAFTTLASRATQILAAGYSEMTSPGFVSDAGGRVRKGQAVVRYRRLSDGAPLHSSRGGGDVSLAGYDTDGVKFSVFQGPSGWTTPLFRLRNTTGQEALATDSTDIATLVTSGFSIDGIIGYAITNSQAQVLQPLVPLQRVTGTGLGYRHSTDPQELANLAAAGYTTAKLIGYVVRASTQVTNPSACVGQLPPTDRVATNLGDLTSAQRDRAVLVGKVTACAIERAINGQFTTQTELQVAASLSSGPVALDPQVRAEMLRQTAAWKAVSPTLLGKYGSLDPGQCATPVDSGPAIRALSGGLTGEVNPLIVRAPHCEGAAGADPRSITVVEEITSGGGGGGENPTTTEFTVKPRLYGVKKSPAFAIPTGGDLDQWANEHVDVGLPLIGIATTKSCTPSGGCAKELGEFCVLDQSGSSGQCRSYPIIPANEAPVFTGAGLWDPFGKIRFRPVGNEADADTFNTVINARVGSTTDGRCNPQPVDQDPSIQHEPCNAGGGFANPLCGLKANENRVETLGIDDPTFNLTAGRFYRVEAVNQNGDYFKFGETIPVSEVDREAQGRTIHVCTPSLCTPSPLENPATCTLNGPACSATTGGVWNAPPRPLSACINPNDPLGTLCPETPVEFVSNTMVENTPLLVYVQDPTATVFENTKIHGVQCEDETGADWTGDDELVVTLVGSALGLGAASETGSFGDTWRVSINSGNRKRGPMAASIPLRVTGGDIGGKSEYVLNVGEDDDNGFLIGLTSVVGVGATVAAGFLAPPLAPVAGTVTVILVTELATTNPDDFIGRTAWASSVQDVSSRGGLTHDLDRATPVSLLPEFSNQIHFQRDPSVSAHPAVDLFAYRTNGDVPTASCVNDAGCSTDQRCFIGVCVPSNWSDPTVAPVAPVAPGHIERRRFVGDSTDYRVYIAHSIGGENAKLH